MYPATLIYCVMLSVIVRFTIFMKFFSIMNIFISASRLLLICSYFSGDLSPTVLIKLVLNKKKKKNSVAKYH